MQKISLNTQSGSNNNETRSLTIEWKYCIDIQKSILHIPDKQFEHLVTFQQISF